MPYACSDLLYLLNESNLLSLYSDIFESYGLSPKYLLFSATEIIISVFFWLKFTWYLFPSFDFQFSISLWLSLLLKKCKTGVLIWQPVFQFEDLDNLYSYEYLYMRIYCYNFSFYFQFIEHFLFALMPFFFFNTDTYSFPPPPQQNKNLTLLSYSLVSLPTHILHPTLSS